MARRARPGIINDWDTTEEQIIYYRTHLDIFIEEAFAPIKLTPTQHVIARAIGNNDTAAIIASRGYGKTWLLSLIGFALCVLYPGTSVLVVAPTAHQATLSGMKLRDLANNNENIANEISAAVRNYVSIDKDSCKCILKNGSKFESVAIESARGRRAKMVLVDEARDVDMDILQQIVNPTRNETRYNPRTYGFPDFMSKIIYISSACPKSFKFYEKFKEIVENMAKGEPGYFACVLDYNTPVAEGLTDISFFEKERHDIPEETFKMEYESKFLGTTENSAFPYELVQTCRTLDQIEMEQPRGSKSRYIISLDIATSKAKGSDNSVMMVHKFTEKKDGAFARKVVNIRSFNGQPLDFLAAKVREYYHVRFPNAEKIVYDARGLGDSFDRFFDKEWIDPVSGREFPPLVVDDEPLTNPDAEQALHPFRAVNQLNQRIYTNLRVALEKQILELPSTARMIREQQLSVDESHRMSNEEYANFQEADALQIEMGNVVAKPGVNGNVLYDVPKATMHKDRYSSLAMGNDYISELEKENMKKHRRGVPCIGVVSAF